MKNKKNTLVLGILSLYALGATASIPPAPANVPDYQNTTLGHYAGPGKTGVFTPFGVKKSTATTPPPATPPSTPKTAASMGGKGPGFTFDAQAAKASLKKTTSNATGNPMIGAAPAQPPAQPTKTPPPVQFKRKSSATSQARQPSQPATTVATAPAVPLTADPIDEFINYLSVRDQLFASLKHIKNTLLDCLDDGYPATFSIINPDDLDVPTSLLVQKIIMQRNQPSSLSVSLSQNEQGKQIDIFINTIQNQGMLTNFAQQATTINDIKNYLELLLANGTIIGLNADDLLDENSDLRQTLDTFVLSLQQPEPATSSSFTPPNDPAVTNNPATSSEQSIPTAPPLPPLSALMPQQPTTLAKTTSSANNDPFEAIRKKRTEETEEEIKKREEAFKKFEEKEKEEKEEKEKKIRENTINNSMLGKIAEEAARRIKQNLYDNNTSNNNNNDDDDTSDDDEWDDDQNDGNIATSSSTTTDYYKKLETALKRNHTIDLETHSNYSQLITEQKNNLQKMQSAFILKDQIENDLKNNIYIDILNTYPQFQTLPKEDQLDILSQQIRGFVNANASYDLISYPLWNQLTPLIRLSFLVKQNKKYDYTNDSDWQQLTDHNKKQILQLAKPNPINMLAAQRAAFGADEDDEDDNTFTDDE